MLSDAALEKTRDPLEISPGSVRRTREAAGGSSTGTMSKSKLSYERARDNELTLCCMLVGVGMRRKIDLE
jgi:hypothetical protein